MKKKLKLNKPLRTSAFSVPIDVNSDEIDKDITEADFETAVSATGFGKFNIIILIVAIPSGWAAMLDSTTMSYVLPAAECDLDLSLEQKGLLNAITYLGMVTSAFLWGFLADTLGRKKLMVIGYFLDSLFVLLAGLSQNYGMLLFAKYMSGFIINGPFAALTAVISEFHCAKYRARVLMVMGIIYSIAILVLPFFAWLVIPRDMDVELLDGKFKLHSWNFFILFCAIPSVVSSIAHTFLPESPKFLMTVGRNEQALSVFKRVYAANTGKPPDTFPIKSLIDESQLNAGGKHGGVVTANRTKKQALKEGWQQMTPLFFRPHRMRLVLICTIQMGFMLGTNTLRLWLPQIFTAINDYQFLHPGDPASLCTMLDSITSSQNETITECVVNKLSDSVYINAGIVSSVSIVGFLSVGVLINTLGKKRMLIILGIIGGVCGTSIYFAQNSETAIALSSLMTATCAVNVNVMITVAVDIFPTSLRTMTVSTMMMMGRMGAMLGNLVFPYLLETGCLPPFCMIGLITITCALLTILLPKSDLKALE